MGEGPRHYHCPNDCEKPQPFTRFEEVPFTSFAQAHKYGLVGETVYCGRCLHEGRGLVKVFLCTPEVCDD